MPTSKTRIGIVDDHTLFRKGMSGLLSNAGFSVVLEASNGEDLLQLLGDMSPERQPGLVLMDLQMPQMDGFRATRILQSRYPGIKVLAISMHIGDQMICQAMDCGASGFVGKEEDVDVLIGAIESVGDKGYYLSEKVSNIFYRRQLTAGSPNPLLLSEREKEIVRLICEQKSMREIAGELGLSPRTVESHKASILKKTNTRNTAGIVLYALTNNLAGKIF